MTNERTDVAATIERLRAEKYSDLPGELVAAVVKIEAQCPDDRIEARRQIAAAIESYLEGKANA